VPANCGSGEQVGAGLDTNRIARKRFNGLESHPIPQQSDHGLQMIDFSRR
jgi:hypothetical protein